MDSQEVSGYEIAIIGMAGRFPGAADLEEFWRNLREGEESISRFTEAELLAGGIAPGVLEQSSYVRAGAVLEDVAGFDAGFFGITPREAEVLDPQQRLFLECAWEALEVAGYTAAAYDHRIGVYAGTGISTYLLANLYPNRALMEAVGMFQILIGNEKDFLPTRVSHLADLRGPSVNVQTACSTALVAVHLACQSLLNAECELALAGGVAVRVPHRVGYWYHGEGIFSPDGHCRAFDAEAQGTVPGSGVGVVVLKRLAAAQADGDTILAVIKASAINNDGSLKVSYTAPSVESQAAVIAEALALAEVPAETIAYVEAHGTGTPLGDPIEIAALTKAFRAQTEKRGYCAVGTVKSNIGHADAAAGVAGLIKTVLALQHRQLPPSLHFGSPNPAIDFAHSPFYVNTSLADWPSDGTPRRAAVSSLGIGGTNAHLILEEAPPRAEAEPGRAWQLLLLSAKSASALEQASANLASYLRRQAEVPLADVAYTLQVGRQPFAHRRLLLCQDHADALDALDPPDPRRVLSHQVTQAGRPVVFMFPGLGEQYAQMGRGLYEAEPTFRAEVDRCAALLHPHLGLDLREVLYPGERQGDQETRRPGDRRQETGDRRSQSAGHNPEPGACSLEPGDATQNFFPDSQLDQTSPAQPEVDLREMLLRGQEPADAATRTLNQAFLVQPALFVIEYALAQLWMEWGIRPQALIGYSLGEYGAACLAGVLTLEDALFLVARRARMIHELPEGAMLAVSLPEEEIHRWLGPSLSLAAVNGPSLCVVAGPTDAIADLAQQLTESKLVCRRLQTTHAVHSAMMAPTAERFRELVETIDLQPPQIPYISNVTGTWITAAEATDPGYWVRHLGQTVRLADGLATLWSDPARIFLEVGPGQTLSALALQQRASPTPERVVLPSLPAAYERQPDQAVLLTSLGKLWLAGVGVDWAGFYAHERRQRRPVPTYPFEHQRYWVDPPELVHRSGDHPTAGNQPAGADGPYTSYGALHPRPNLMNDYVAPSTEIEQDLAAIWQEVLGIEEVGIHDNFMALGGHSLMATVLVSRLRDTFQVEVPLPRFFEAPTVAQLAEVVEELLIEKIEALSEDEVERLISSTVDDN